MTRQVVITGLGPVCGAGIGIDAVWDALVHGRSAIGPVRAFNPAGFDCRIAAEVRDFKVSDYVPKNYRKATKVMARDIELAVAAADRAVRDARLLTRGTAGDGQTPTYPPPRVGAHIGAGLIAAELNELTSALVEARDPDTRGFNIHHWGREGMNHLTPLWLLKYLPNMLACHVTIVHDARGPSNTITCGEASGGLSIGESLRVIQRGGADMCLCGGMESKLNPMAFLRQHLAQRLTTTGNDDPTGALRPFSKSAAGGVVGEGGGIVVLEALETFRGRNDGRAYAQVVGFGASQTVNPRGRNLEPDLAGRGIAIAITAALREAGVETGDIDLVIPFGSGLPAADHAEAAALRQVFGPRVSSLPVVSIKPVVGVCGAGTGGLDVIVAAKALAEQTIPATLNCDDPLDGLNARTAPARSARLNHVLTYSTSMGGQNAALLLRRLDA